MQERIGGMGDNRRMNKESTSSFDPPFGQMLRLLPGVKIE
jgi:hypothetical protein